MGSETYIDMIEWLTKDEIIESIKYSCDWDSMYQIYLQNMFKHHECMKRLKKYINKYVNYCENDDGNIITENTMKYYDENCYVDKNNDYIIINNNLLCEDGYYIDMKGFNVITEKDYKKYDDTLYIDEDGKYVDEDGYLVHVEKYEEYNKKLNK